MITTLAYVCFWVCSVAAFVSSRTLLSQITWLPSLISSILSLLVGAFFGIAMVECFVRLRGIKQRFEQEPVNGATGAQITILELLLPYVQIGLVAVLTAPVFIKARQRNGLDLPTVPEWALYSPAIIALVMIMAVAWSQILSKKRD